MSCCDPRGCDQLFTPRCARRLGRRYRRRGPDRETRRMADLVARAGIEGATVLEIGGGLGDLQLELLGRGAGRAVNLELSPSYEDEATRLLREAGLEGQVERRLHDIAVDPHGVEPADVVVLNRVVCCYPDYDRLLGAAAERARRLLVFNHPPRNRFTRLVVAVQNAAFRLLRKDFRTFAHPPEAMVAVLHERGLQPAFADRGLIWHAVGMERRPS